MILGPEVWRVDDHATWTHWDLWFCAVWAADFGGDRASFAAELRRRHDGPFGRPDWDSFLSHLDDLECRLVAAELTPVAVAADSLGDKTIMAKARRKVLERGLSIENLTPAMIDTPRARLGRRALRGRWDQVSRLTRPRVRKVCRGACQAGR